MNHRTAWLTDLCNGCILGNVANLKAAWNHTLLTSKWNGSRFVCILRVSFGEVCSPPTIIVAGGLLTEPQALLGTEQCQVDIPAQPNWLSRAWYCQLGITWQPNLTKQYHSVPQSTEHICQVSQLGTK